MNLSRVLLPFLGLPALALAVQTGVLLDEGYASFFGGELEQVTLSRSGELGTAPGLREIVQLDEPSVWAVVTDLEGNFIVGTGNAGKVLRVTAEGEVETLFAPDSILTRALAVDEAGNLYVGTSPNGAIYRLGADGGKPEVFFDPEDTYLWDFAVHDGSLWVATGRPARFLRVSLEEGAEEPVEEWFRARDDNLRTLLRRGDEWLIGSSGRGIVYAISAPGEARALFKADQSEIRALGLIGEAELLVATYDEKGSSGPSLPSDAGDLPAFVVRADDSGDSSPRGSKAASGGIGFLLRVDAQGVARPEWRSTEGGIFSLAALSDRFWLLGFNRDGKLYGFAHRDDWELLHQMPRGGEISVIHPGLEDEAGFYLFTSNPAVMYRLGGRAEVPSVFRSRILDARQAVRWGRMELTMAAEGALTVETRTGFTDKPDSTWSDWAALENAQIRSPAGRFLQYRLTFPPESEARLVRARAFYAMPNTAPVITAVRVLGFGAELRASSPGSGLLDFGALLRSGSAAEDGDRQDRLKLTARPEQTLRTVLWQAIDPNGDALRYTVSIRPVESATWTVLARNLVDPVFVFNAAGLTPGYYRVRVEASDLVANSPADAATATRESELVLLDATPPTVTWKRADDEPRTLRFEVTSDWSRLVVAQVIVDGGEPLGLRPVDGLFDGLSEVFEFTVPNAFAGRAVSVLFEVLDESGNQTATTVDLAK